LEEFSALNPFLLIDQAYYVNDVVASLKELYQVDHVPVLGHSMGGVSSRLAPLLDNYDTGSIQQHITFSTPHVSPPLSFPECMSELYHFMNNAWKKFIFSNDPDSVMYPRVSLLSIYGGHLDTQIAPHLSDLDNMFPETANIAHFSIETTAIQKVGTPCDHLSIMWCGQLMPRVGLSLYRTQTNPEQKFGNPKEIIEVYSKIFLGNSTLESRNGTNRFDFSNMGTSLFATDMSKLVQFSISSPTTQLQLPQLRNLLIYSLNMHIPPSLNDSLCFFTVYLQTNSKSRFRLIPPVGRRFDGFLRKYYLYIPTIEFQALSDPILTLDSNCTSNHDFKVGIIIEPWLTFKNLCASYLFTAIAMCFSSLLWIASMRFQTSMFSLEYSGPNCCAEEKIQENIRIVFQFHSISLRKALLHVWYNKWVLLCFSGFASLAFDISRRNFAALLSIVQTSLVDSIGLGFCLVLLGIALSRCALYLLYFTLKGCNYLYHLKRFRVARKWGSYLLLIILLAITFMSSIVTPLSVALVGIMASVGFVYSLKFSCLTFGMVPEKSRLEFGKVTLTLVRNFVYWSTLSQLFIFLFLVSFPVVFASLHSVFQLKNESLRLVFATFLASLCRAETLDILCIISIVPNIITWRRVLLVFGKCFQNYSFTPSTRVQQICKFIPSYACIGCSILTMLHGTQQLGLCVQVSIIALTVAQFCCYIGIK
jgi:hypothetical protein